ncbi:hypothetical protein, partial [Klebsiella pneumoniae]|uniref:hypothetical protein n=1 Tax=Klebsiella pneumoniae TaxID=573 RepID=UPI0025A13A62
SGGLVCRKITLKNLYDPKTAGGCGVAPISSGKDLFCRAVAQPAHRCCNDLFYLFSGVRVVLCTL